jgi:hypothetical protein
MRLPLTVTVVIVASWLSTGCATFAHGSRERVSITTNPPGATIFINGEPTEQITPATIALPRRRGHTLTLEHDGYVTQEVNLKRRPSNWLWLNLGLCANPAAIQGLDSPSQFPLVLLTCFATFTGIDLLSGAFFAVQKKVTVDLLPAGVKVVPVQDCIEPERIRPVGLPPPERTDREQHDMPLAEPCVDGGGAAGKRLSTGQRARQQ